MLPRRDAVAARVAAGEARGGGGGACVAGMSHAYRLGCHSRDQGVGPHETVEWRTPAGRTCCTALSAVGRDLLPHGDVDVDVIKKVLGTSFGPLAPEPSAVYQPLE